MRPSRITDQNALDIYIGNRKTATLVRDPDRFEYALSYAKGAKTPLSLTMPLFDGTDIYMILPPVLQTSLPEGELLAAIYQKVGKVLKISDDFDILKLVGGNMIGRIVCVPPGVPPRNPGPFIEHDRLMALLRSPESRTLLTQSMVEFAEKTGISGVLPKVFGLSNFRITLPSGRFIVKSESREFPGICAVEHLCMAACTNAGLKTPGTILSEDGQTLLIERFDIGNDGQAIGFEDFCSLGGLDRRAKYDKSYEFAMELASLFLGEDDRRDLFKAYALMHFLRNGEAHLKNFGVLYTSESDVRLAPVYDVVTTTAFLPNDSPALPYRGERRWLQTEELVEFALNQCQIPEKLARTLILECLDGIEKTIPLIERLSKRHRFPVLPKTLRVFRNALGESSALTR